MTQLDKAIQYALRHPKLSLHHTAVKFGVCAYKLKDEYARQYQLRKVTR